VVGGTMRSMIREGWKIQIVIRIKWGTMLLSLLLFVLVWCK